MSYMNCSLTWVALCQEPPKWLVSTPMDGNFSCIVTFTSGRTSMHEIASITCLWKGIPCVTTPYNTGLLLFFVLSVITQAV
jgi:hypothetical protein